MMPRLLVELQSKTEVPGCVMNLLFLSAISCHQALIALNFLAASA
jgi:hypothetical protein